MNEAPTYHPTDAMRLQLNTTGAWRNLVQFDYVDSAKVLDAAVALFAFEPRASLRVIEADNATAKPLMHWSLSTGWRIWGDHARQA